MIPLPKLLNGTAEERRIRPVKVSINENIVPLSTASMVILKEDVFPERSYVELFTPNGSAGVYRTRAPEIGYGSDTVTVNLEHGVCEVGDYIVREKADNAQKTLAAAVQHFFSFYSGTRWQLGTISASGNVIVSSNYQNVLSAILSAVQQIPTAMVAFDFTTTPWTMSIRNRGTTVEAEGRLSRNIKSAKVKRDDSSLATRVWLEGLGTGGAVGHMDADTISTYGVIEVSLSGRNYTQAQAQTVASAYLARHKRPIYSITIDGTDWSQITGETLDRMVLGKLYRLAIPEDGVVLEENITVIRWTDIYGQPGSCTVSLAEPPETAITFLQGKANEVSGSIGAMGGAVASVSESLASTQADVSLIWQKTGINSLGQQETLMTRIQANANGISTEVSRATSAEATINGRVTTVNTTLSSRITQTAEQIAQEVVRATIAENSKLEKTNAYQNVNAVIAKAQEMADAAAVTAKNASIAKTSTLQTANAIVSTAVAQAATAASNTYIAKTTRYQTADEIYQEAALYADGEIDELDTTLRSYIRQRVDEINITVENKTTAASIVAGINAQTGSYVKIKADSVDIEGIVHATEARIDKLVSGDTTAYILKGRWIVAETLHIQQDFFFGPDSAPMHIGPINVTISGTNYTFLGVI